MIEKGYCFILFCLRSGVIPISKGLTKNQLLTYFKAPLLEHFFIYFKLVNKPIGLMLNTLYLHLFFKKTTLIIVGLLLLPFTCANALIAATAKAIEGNAPQVANIDLAASKHGFTVGGVFYSEASSNMKGNAVNLFDGNLKPSSFAVKNFYYDSLDNKLNYTDKDGDQIDTYKPFLLSFTSSKWYDANGKALTNISQRLACDNAYTLPLTLEITAQLKTYSKYGIPKESDYVPVTKRYQISHKPTVCYAQPNLANDSSNNTQYQDLDGPDWGKGKGFIPQDINTAAKNFPSTGSDNLRFYLLLSGITPQEVVNINGSTIKSSSGNVTLLLSAENTPGWGNSSSVSAVKIVLKGPTTSTANKSFSPVTFQLYSDKAKQNILYSFTIQRWYLTPSVDVVSNQSSAISYCRGIGYRLPSVADYTNANTSIWSGGIPGRNINGYRRQLSYRGTNGKWIGGLFNEWGTMFNQPIHYPGTNWASDHPGDWYWAMETYQGNPIRIDAGDGDMWYNEPSFSSYHIACVSP